MKKDFFLFILIIVYSYNVYSQKNKIETFDINKYIQLKEIKENKDTYQQSEKGINSNYTLIKSYYKNSLTLKSKVNFFQSFPVSVQENYNKAGKRINKKNWDKNYSFSISDLAVKMRHDFNIDILESNNRIGVLRGSSDSVNYYLVSIPLSTSMKSDYRSIKINGASGEIISDKIFTYSKD